MLGNKPVPSAQPKGNPNDPVTMYSGALPDHPEFTELYWASLDPALHSLRKMDAGPKRMQLAWKLADEGYIVDAQIMAEGLDPWKIMAWRIHYGYPWVPSALMPSPSAVPGYTQPTVPPPGTANYDWNGPMPKGAIKVSIDPKDYPPFVPTIAKK